MKTSKKIVSVLLAVLMVLGMTSTALAGAVNTDKYNTVDKLIGQDSIADIVGYVVEHINDDDFIGTAIRLVSLFADNEVLNEKVTAATKSKDITALSNEELAKILVDFLNDERSLPTWTKEIMEKKIDVPVLGEKSIPELADMLDVKVDLTSVDGVIKTLYDVCDLTSKKMLDLDSLNNLKSSSLYKKNGSKEVVYTVKGDGNLKAIKAIVGFLGDNVDVIKKAVRGELSLNIKIHLGVTYNVYDATSQVKDIVNQYISKEKIMDKLYLLVDGKAAEGDFAKSAYKDYTADQLIAAGLIRMIKNVDAKTVIITKEECNKALELNFYELLAQYGPEFIKNYRTKDGSSLIEKLNAFGNEYMAKLIRKLDEKNVDESIKNRFEFTPFTDSDFDEIFETMTKDGILNQFNDICCLIADHILSDAAYTELDLKEGANTNLNENFTKIFRYTLPAIASIGTVFGFDFSEFTQEKVDTMTLPEMGAAILKIFFPGWFKANFTDEARAAVNDAKTIDQLAVIAAKLALTNSDWIKFELSEPDKIEFGKIKTYDSAACKNAIIKMGAEVAALTLDYNKSTTHFTLAANRDDWTYADYLNAVANWGLDFVNGIPKVAQEINLKGQDKEGAFYKLNVVLNEFIDFSFVDAGNSTFKLDLETLLFDKLLGNLFNLDFAGILDTFKKNSDSSNILNGKIIPGTVSAVNKLLTAVFEHNCSQVTDTVQESMGNCKYNTYKYTYCKNNGHYMGDGKKFTGTTTIHKDSWVITKEANCKTGTKGEQKKICSVCGTVTDTKTINANHVFNVTVKTIPATTESDEIIVKKCAKCGTEKNFVQEGTKLQPQKLTVNTATHIKLKNNVVVSDVSVKASAMLSASNATKLIDKNGKDVAANTTLGTGMKLVLISDGKTVDTKEIAVLGDIDGNGAISVSDARSVLRAAVNLDTLTGAAFTAADVDFSNEISVSDARNILRAAVSLDKPDAWIANLK